MKVKSGTVEGVQYVAIEGDDGYAYQVGQKPFEFLTRVIMTTQLEEPCSSPKLLVQVKQIIALEVTALKKIAELIGLILHADDDWTYIQSFLQSRCIKDITFLKLPGSKFNLSCIPFAIGGMVNLTELDLSGNEIGFLPPDLAQLINLRIFDIRKTVIHTMTLTFSPSTTVLWDHTDPTLQKKMLSPFMRLPFPEFNYS